MKKVLVLGCVIAGMLLVSFGSLAASNDAWIPGLASFVLPGLGQVLNDQMDKAILHFAVFVGIHAIGIPASLYWYGPVGYIEWALSLGWAAYSFYDAYTVAKETHFTLGFVESGVGFSYTF